jgi:hypothetical protein
MLTNHLARVRVSRKLKKNQNQGNPTTRGT